MQVLLEKYGYPMLGYFVYTQGNVKPLTLLTRGAPLLLAIQLDPIQYLG